MENRETSRVLDRMRNLCSRREYCCADIRKKVLAALDGDCEETEKIIEILVAERYVDDFRYASAFARDKSSLAGWGDVKIRYMLSSKGVARDVVDRALHEIDSSKALSRLEKLMENKYRVLKDDPQCRIRMLRFALGRGYGYDEVVSVMDRLMNKKD